MSEDKLNDYQLQAVIDSERSVAKAIKHLSDVCCGELWNTPCYFENKSIGLIKQQLEMIEQMLLEKENAELRERGEL